MATPTVEITKHATVYGRMQKVRNLLQAMNLQKSGKNSYTNASYYELGDFEPQLNQLCDEQGIMPLFLLEKEKSKLWVINVDKPEEKMLFYIPVEESGLKGATPIQNLGAQITYLRRYLLMIAFEISEGDTEDAQVPEELKKIDQIHIDKINAATTLRDLNEVGSTLQKELGNDFRKAIVAQYTRRKKEIESTTKPNTYK